jgi:hypothetical protein
VEIFLETRGVGVAPPPPLQTTRRGSGVGQGPRKLYRILRCIVGSYGLDSLLVREVSTVKDWGISLKPPIFESRVGGLVTYSTLRNAGYITVQLP